MSVTPEIKTKFTLAGLREATAGFRLFGKGAKDSLDGVKAKAADALKPMEKDIERAKRSLRGLQLAAGSVGTVGFAGMLKGAKLSFTGITVGAAAAAASVAGIGAAAIKASRDSSVELGKFAQDAKRLGVSTEDLSVLSFAAARESVDPEEVTKGIAKIGTEFLKVRQAIADGNAEFRKMHALASGDATLALLGRDAAGFQSAADSIAAARGGSMAAINERIAFVQDQISKLDSYGGPRLDFAGQLSRAKMIQQRRQELSELLKMQETMRKSFGPAGEALFGLEAYGLDVDKASRGGVTGFVALGDAIRQVHDPVERLRYSVLLFGEDAGPKMLNLLMSGRKGLEDYRRELERLGGVVTEADAKIGGAYQDSAENLQRSIGGVKLAVSRELLPLLTETNAAVTEWLVKSRGSIASLVKAGFVGTRNLTTDAMGIFGGQRSGFKTEWLNAAFKKLDELMRKVRDFRREVETAMNGDNSHYEWLNKIRDGLFAVRDLVMDVFEVLRGGDAQKFTWLNALRDGVTEFAQSFKDAFDAFMDVLGFIKDSLIRPISDFLNTDPMTLALFVGMARFTGILGMATIAVTGLSKALVALFGLKGGAKLAASVAGIARAAGTAGTGAGLAAGAAGAAGVTGRGALLARGAGVLGAAAYGGWQAGRYLGQKAEDWSGITDRRLRIESMAAERARMVGDASFWKRYRSLPLEQQKAYWTHSRGISYDDGFRGAQIFADNARNAAAYGLKLPGQSQKIEVELNVGGKRFGMEADALTARGFAHELQAANRRSY